MSVFYREVTVSRGEIVLEFHVGHITTCAPSTCNILTGCPKLLCSNHTGAGRLTHLLYELIPYYPPIHLHLWLSPTCPFLLFLSPSRRTLLSTRLTHNPLPLARKTITDLLFSVLLPLFLPVFPDNLLLYALPMLYQRVLTLTVSRHFSRPRERGMPAQRRNPTCERNSR